LFDIFACFSRVDQHMGTLYRTLGQPLNHFIHELVLHISFVIHFDTKYIHKYCCYC